MNMSGSGYLLKICVCGDRGALLVCRSEMWGFGSRWRLSVDGEVKSDCLGVVIYLAYRDDAMMRICWAEGWSDSLY